MFTNIINVFQNSTQPTEAELNARLIGERNRTVEQKNATIKDLFELVRNTDDWVKVWVDEGQYVRDDASKVTATRAITDEGQLIWMVKLDGKRFSYHATSTLARDAFEEAKEAREKRRLVTKRWTEVKQLRRDILLGRRRLRVTIEDAKNAGLCTLGINGFLKKTGMGQKPDYPAFILMLVSLFDRQVAFPVFAAHLRVMRGKTVQTEKINRTAA